MCRRYELKASTKEVEKQFSAVSADKFDAQEYYIPQNKIPVILHSRKNKENEIRTMQWGLIPSWAKDPAIGEKMYNARSETLAIKPSFQAAFDQRRCIIPATGFYESHKQSKQSFLVTPNKGKLFALAGLWERWRAPNGEVVTSCTIITTPSVSSLETIHERMPAILDEKGIELWLSSTSKQPELQQLLSPNKNIVFEQA